MNGGHHPANVTEFAAQCDALASAAAAAGVRIHQYATDYAQMAALNVAPLGPPMLPTLNAVPIGLGAMHSPMIAPLVPANVFLPPPYYYAAAPLAQPVNVQPIGPALPLSAAAVVDVDRVQAIQRVHKRERSDDVAETHKAKRKQKREEVAAVTVLLSQSSFLKSMSDEFAVASAGDKSPPLPPTDTSQWRISSSAPAAVHLEAFTDCLTAFLSSYTADDVDAIPYKPSTTTHEPTLQTLANLMKTVTKHHQITQVSVDALHSFILILIALIERGTSIDLIRPFQRPNAGDIDIVSKSLESARIGIILMTQPNISRQLIRDDQLESTIKLMLHVCQKAILPLYDFVLQAKLSGVTTEQADDDDGADDTAESDETKRSNSKSATAKAGDSEYWLGAHTALKRIRSQICSLFRHLSALIRIESTQDRHVNPLIDTAFALFAADTTPDDLLKSAHTLIIAAFMHGHETRRNAILDSLIAAFRLIAQSSQKRVLRSFVIDRGISTSFRAVFAPLNKANAQTSTPSAQTSASIQPLAALIMEIIQSLASHTLQSRQQHILKTLGTSDNTAKTEKSSSSTETDGDLSVSTKVEMIDSLRHHFTSLEKSIWYFVHFFIDRLQPSQSGAIQFKQTQATIRNFIDDLLSVLFLPEWPAAEEILKFMVIYLLQILERGYNKANDVKTGKGGVSNESRLCQLTVTLVGLIYQHLQAHALQSSLTPLIIRSRRTILNESATPHSADEITHCICGFRAVGSDEKAHFAGLNTLMIDCDECRVWYHASCCGIYSESDVPAKWMCESCILKHEVQSQQQNIKGKIFKRRLSSSQDDIEDHGDVDAEMDVLKSENEPIDDAEMMKALAANELVLNQLLINYLSSSVDDELILSARQFHLMQWMHNAMKTEDKSSAHMDDDGRIDPATVQSAVVASDLMMFTIINWPPRTTRLVTALDSPSLPREGQFRVSRQLALSRELMTSRALMRTSLLAKCTDPLPMFRAKAVAAISGVIRVDPAMLEDMSVRQTLVDRILDHSTSTREAVIDLIGGQIIQHPELLAPYYSVVIQRSTDVGVSVRKRVVKIIRDLLIHPTVGDSSHVQSRYSDMIVKLVVRIRDDASVIHLVTQTFQHLWFSADNPVIANRRNTRQSLSSLATQELRTMQVTSQTGAESFDSASNTHFSADFHHLVRHVIDVVALLQSDGLDCLQDIIETLIERQSIEMAGGADGKPKRSRKKSVLSEAHLAALRADMRAHPHSVRAICMDICSCAVEQLISADDDTANAKPQFVLGAVQTLYAFNRVSSAFVLDHAHTLLPYLKHAVIDSGVKESDQRLWPLVEQLLAIYFEIIPLIKSPTPQFVHHMREDLKLIVLRSPRPSLMTAAMPCLCKLLEYHDVEHIDLLWSMASKFYSVLANINADLSSTMRCLQCAGLLCKYFDVDAYGAAQLPPKRIKPTIDSIVDALFEQYKRFMQSNQSSLQLCALRGLIALFARKPKLIIKSEAIMQIVLSPNASSELHVQALKSLREFLQSDDQRVVRAQKLQVKVDVKAGQSDNKSVDVSDDQSMDGDLNFQEEADDDAVDDEDDRGWLDSRIDIGAFVPALVQQCERLVPLLVASSDPAVRIEAVRFMSLYLHQGVTIPIDSMPTLIAALTDRDERVSTSALNAIHSLCQKKRNLAYLEQRFLQGVKLSYLFQVNRAPMFDPLQLAPIDKMSDGNKVFDATPFDKVGIIYNLIKKTVTQRRTIAAGIVNELLSSNQQTNSTNWPQTSPAMPTPEGADILETIDEDLPPSQPTFRPPVTSTPIPSPSPTVSPLVHPSTPLTPTIAPLQSYLTDERLYKLGLIVYSASFVTSLPFDDDEPLHIVYYLNRVTSSKGAELMGEIDQILADIEAIGNGTAEESTLIPAQRSISASPLMKAPSALDDKLADLRRLCESGMAVSILLHLRNHLTAVYALEGRFDGWNISQSQAKGKVRLTKRLDLPLTFDNWPFAQNNDTSTQATPQSKASVRSTPAQSRSRSRSKSNEVPTPIVTAAPVVPPLLQQQIDLFRSLLDGTHIALTNVKNTRRRSSTTAPSSNPPSRHRRRGTTSKTAARKKKLKYESESSEESPELDDDEEEEEEAANASDDNENDAGDDAEDVEGGAKEELQSGDDAAEFIPTPAPAKRGRRSRATSKKKKRSTKGRRASEKQDEEYASGYDDD